MMLVADFAMDVDIIRVPKIVIENAKYYQEQFFIWLFDKSNDHKYWCYKDGEKFGCNYRSDAFVEWLNANPLKDFENKAIILSTHVMEYDRTLRKLRF